MKLRILCLSLIIMLAALPVLVGCSSNNDKATESNTKATSATETSTSSQKVKVTVNDSIDGEIKITPASNTPKCNIDVKNFLIDENGFLSYSYESMSSLVGIDVSSYSGDIDWAKVKQSGIDFAIIRIGGRGYGDTGNIYTDDKAIENINNAEKNNIKVGVYFYSQAVSTSEATQEAEFVVSLLNGTKLDLPIAYDFEHIDNDSARTDDISGAQMTKFAKSFCSVIKKAGYEAMIYGESHDFYKNYDLEKLSGTQIWLAQYSDTPDFYYSFKIWQYSTDGKVNGIDGTVDLNIMFTEK